MLLPLEAIGFRKVVMQTYEIPEFVSNWERLRNTPLRGEKAMKMFIADVRDTVWDRLPAETRAAICLEEELDLKVYKLGGE